jgi:hypothetical protein
MKIIRAISLAFAILVPTAAIASPAVRAPVSRCCPGVCCPDCPFCPNNLHR